MRTNNGYFLHWYNHKKIVQKIREHLGNDGVVALCTHTQAVVYKRKHVDYFRATPEAALVQHGKHWNRFAVCGSPIVAVRFYPAGTTFSRKRR